MRLCECGCGEPQNVLRAEGVVQLLAQHGDGLRELVNLLLRHGLSVTETKRWI